MGDAEWGPDVAHDGNGCPLPDGTYVWVLLADGTEAEGVIKKRPSVGREVNVWRWDECEASGLPQWRLIIYRVRQFAALAELKHLAMEPYSVPASLVGVPA